MPRQLFLFLFPIVTGLLDADTAATVQTGSCQKHVNRLTKEFGEKLAKHEAEMGKLKSQVEKLVEEIHQLKQTSANRPNVKRQVNFEEEVGFSARVSTHLRSLAAHQTIIFGTTLTNIGSHYNNLTGIFVAPISGTYQFYVNILSENNNAIETELILNNHMIAEIYSGAARYYGAGSNHVIVRLKKGDQVWVKVHDHYSTDMNVHCCWSTFSGYLLHQLVEETSQVIG